MQPVTIIELVILFSVIIIFALLAFLLPRKRRKIAWTIAGIALIIGLCFYSVRPFIVQHQTDQALDILVNHLNETYPDELRTITNTDPYQLSSAKYLHVIFNNEPDIVYEYRIEDGEPTQVGMWLRDGGSIETNGIQPLHADENLQH